MKGVFPDKLKITKIIPTFKAGNKENYKVISPIQYGFRENMSTSYILTELVNKITASLGSKLLTMGVFICLNKILIQVIINCFVKKIKLFIK